jgi:hypothetical protein
MQTHRRTVQSMNRGFFLRILEEGDWFYEGADLGILVAPGRFMTDDHQLNERGKAWIKAIRGQYAGRDLRAGDDAAAAAVAEVGGFKML